MLKLFFLLICLSLAAGQFAACGSNCRLLTDCPEMQRFAQSGDPEKIRKVREAICGFDKGNAKVCCADKIVVHGATNPKFVPTLVPIRGDISLGESLLPKRCGNPTTDDKIYGGREAPLGADPWIAAFGYVVPSGPQANRVDFACAGSLITDRYVLTAAHCLDPKELGNRKLSVIHLGDWDLNKTLDCQVTRLGHSKCAPPHIVAGIEEVINHPKYNTRAETSDDIALIRLNVSIDFETTKSHVKPVCLPPKNLNPRIYARDRDPLASGWGFTQHGKYSDILLRVNVPFTDNNLCKHAHGADRFLESEQLCVGGIHGEDTCAGDSGGPLVISSPEGPPFYQIGIVSYGPNPCGQDGVPGVYTSVSAYRDWILENIKP